MVADAEHLHRQLDRRPLPPHRRTPQSAASWSARATGRAAPPSPRSSSRRSCACSCRGNRAGSSPGPEASAARPPTPTRWPSSWPTAEAAAAPWVRAPRRPDPRVATRRPRSRRRSATCSAGWSPPAPVRSATTSARACAGWAGSRSGRSSSPRTGAMVPAPAAAHAAQRQRARARTARTRCGGRRRSSTPTRLAELVESDARAASLALDPSVDARALTRSALTGMVDAICRDSARRLEVPAPPPRVRTVDRRRRGVPRPPRRQRVRRAGARRRRDRDARRAVGAFGHRRARPADRAPRSARRTATCGTSRCSSPRAPKGELLVPIEHAIVERRLGARRPRGRDRAASNACCPRCCGPAEPGAARSSSARTRRGS